MTFPEDQNFDFINLTDFLKGSLLLHPYKEALGHFYGQRLLIATTLWHEGKIDEALPIFDEVYEIWPNFFLHKFIRIAEQFHAMDPESILEELATLPYDDYVESLDKFLYHLTRAVAQFQLFDLDDCIDSCKKALNYIDDVTPVYLLLADSLILRYQFAEALVYYKKVIKFGDFKVDNAKANLAYAYLRLKKNRKARILFQGVVHKFPENYKIQYNMALCYVRRRAYKKALSYLDIVEKLNSDFTGLHLTRAGVYLKLRQQGLAIQCLKQAEALGSPEASAILRKLTT
jgi:tetratricopeptide (TPR) repeat protein